MIKKEYSQISIAFFISIFVVATMNMTFFGKLVAVYPIQEFYFHLTSLSIGLVLLNFILINLFNFTKSPKPLFIFFLFISCLAAYFIDSYNAIIDTVMIENIFRTDQAEVFDLISAKLFLYLLLFTILPALILSKIKIKKISIPFALKKCARAILISLAAIFLLIFTSSKFYASFFREHKDLRYRINPSQPIFSTVKFFGSKFKTQDVPFQTIGLDAKIPDSDTERDLVILVLGETARSDRFSLNGYKNETNPLLKKENVISFTNVFSCGTSTAFSLPCMFSNLGGKHFENDKAENRSNVLDVLAHTNDVNILWRDNNSDSKGVALRVTYEDFKNKKNNPVCDDECRDEGMLIGLQEYIDKATEKDILIILHQMGSHGPAYYKRYPKEFEKFKPTCETNELSNCSLDEISNTYDNTILYTDYFLSKVIGLLKKNDENFETALFYVSDHGESLGENGLYLHSLPNFIAPKEQKLVPLIMWFGQHMKAELDIPGVMNSKDQFYTHDILFHTLLGLFEIQTTVYHQELDILGPYYLEHKR